MSVPSAVQRQLEEAERALAAQQAPASAPTGVVTDVQQLVMQATPPAPTTAVPAPAPPASEPPQAPNWEQKFRTVDGMYRAEVPGLKAANKALESQIVALNEQVRALSTAVEKAATKPVEKAGPDPRDVDQFGPDLVGMVQRYMEQAVTRLDQQVGSVAASLDERLRALEARLNGVSEQSATSLEQHFYATLHAAVPDWEAINSSPSWLEWLSVEDPLTGVARQVILDSAHKKLDAPRVIAVFKSFLGAQPRRDTLSDQVAPASNANVPPPNQAPAQKPLISIKTVEKFYLDQAKGRYTVEEAARIQAELDAAQAEGRILPM